MIWISKIKIYKKVPNKLNNSFCIASKTFASLKDISSAKCWQTTICDAFVSAGWQAEDYKLSFANDKYRIEIDFWTVPTVTRAFFDYEEPNEITEAIYNLIHAEIEFDYKPDYDQQSNIVAYEKVKMDTCEAIKNANGLLNKLMFQRQLQSYLNM